MNAKMFLGIFLLKGAALAAETFGGIGLAIYASDCGAKVAHVVRGSAAERAGFLSGDCLLSANGVKLEGKGLAADMEVLRGTPGEILDLEILRGTESFQVCVRRESLLVQATGETSFRFQSKGNWRILDSVDFPGISAEIYAEKDGIPSKKFHHLQNLERFDRDFISFELKEPGKLTLRLFHADGKHVRTLRLEGISGKNTFSWDGSPYPSGRYLIEVNQGGETLYFKGTLR